jgi:hypothetical protein
MSRKHRSSASTQVGTITEVRDCGTVVLVLIQTEDGWLSPVGFDHRMFRYLLEAEGCAANDLIGRRAESDGLTMTFSD